MRFSFRLTWILCCCVLLSLVLIAISRHQRLHAQQPSQSELDAKLLQAAQNDDAAAVAQLLDQGANIEARGSNECTPLLLASDSWGGAAAKLLLARGASAAAKDKQGDTALMLAARAGNVELVGDLLRRGMSQEERTRALFQAVHGGPVVLEIAESNAPSKPASFVDQWAVTTKLLLETGLDLESRDEEGSTPFMTAAAYAHTEIVRLLLQRGANVKARDKRGSTALIRAACECALATMNSAYDSVKLLLDAGSEVNARANDGMTALMLAAGGFGGVAILKLLVEQGANPAVRNKKGETALAIARQEHNAEKIRYLRALPAPTR